MGLLKPYKLRLFVASFTHKKQSSISVVYDLLRKCFGITD